MTFLHNETSWSIKRLVYVNKKWTYSDTWNTYTGHKKPMWIWDRAFPINDNVEGLYKWTIRRYIWEWKADIKENDRVDILWETYIVKWVKLYEGIELFTTKVLLSK